MKIIGAINIQEGSGVEVHHLSLLQRDILALLGKLHHEPVYLKGGFVD